MPTRWRFCSSFSSVDRMTYTAVHKTSSAAFEYVLFSFKLIPGSRPLIDMTMPQAYQPCSQSSTFFIDCFGTPSHRNNFIFPCTVVILTWQRQQRANSQKIICVSSCQKNLHILPLISISFVLNWSLYSSLALAVF